MPSAFRARWQMEKCAECYWGQLICIAAKHSGQVPRSKLPSKPQSCDGAVSRLGSMVPNGAIFVTRRARRRVAHRRAGAGGNARSKRSLAGTDVLLNSVIKVTDFVKSKSRSGIVRAGLFDAAGMSLMHGRKSVRRLCLRDRPLNMPCRQPGLILHLRQVCYGFGEGTPSDDRLRRHAPPWAG